MPALFDLLIEENPAFRVVLGLFIFDYIHPVLMAMAVWDASLL